MSDAMWQLVQECWANNLARRPLSSKVAQRLKNIVAAENLPTVPEEYVPVKQERVDQVAILTSTVDHSPSLPSLRQPQ